MNANEDELIKIALGLEKNESDTGKEQLHSERLKMAIKNVDFEKVIEMATLKEIQSLFANNVTTKE